jgi:hypothetical protein
VQFLLNGQEWTSLYKPSSGSSLCLALSSILDLLQPLPSFPIRFSASLDFPATIPPAPSLSKMHSTTLISLLSVLSLASADLMLARPVLQRRAGIGGWSLSSNSCPSGTSGSKDENLVGSCCPTDTQLHGIGLDDGIVCCPDGEPLPSYSALKPNRPPSYHCTVLIRRANRDRLLLSISSCPFLRRSFLGPL